MTRLDAVVLSGFLLAASGLACRGPAARNTSDAPAAAAASNVGGPTSAPAAKTTPPDQRVVTADEQRIMGNPNAKLWMLVVSDFQCPYCGQWEHETAAQFKKEFVDAGLVRVAFINFPLGQHENALPAAEAAMCAGAQSRFWAMHDKIFERQGAWSALPDASAVFREMAKELGLDLAAYDQCIGTHVMRPMIEADRARASGAGAKSTPTFLIGNITIAGAEKIESFRTAVAQALKSASP